MAKIGGRTNGTAEIEKKHDDRYVAERRLAKVSKQHKEYLSEWKQKIKEVQEQGARTSNRYPAWLPYHLDFTGGDVDG